MENIEHSTSNVERPRLRILQGDCVERMRELAAERVQCVVTSPPYDKLRTYGRLEWDFEDAAFEISRLLSPGGIICWNVGDQCIDGSESLTSFKQAIHFVETLKLRLHDTMIWHKLNFSSPSFNRYHQTFEYIFIFSKGKPRCFNPLKDRHNATAGLIGNLGVNTFALGDGTRSERKKNLTAEMGMRHNVWEGKTRGQEDMCEKLPHPAMMPKWLARDLILSFSNVGDLVLDPFGGSGTVGVQAISTGRRAILIDKEPEYVELMKSECDVTPGLALA
jgi:DNA modification methylase